MCLTLGQYLLKLSDLILNAVKRRQASTVLSNASTHLERLKGSNPALGDIELIDVRTPAILSRHRIKGPVCLVGSKTYKQIPEQIRKWRDAYRGIDPNGFTGIDIEDGLNVDVVADLCASRFPQNHPELVNKFGLVVCGALLEHVRNPFDAARNVTALIRPSGCLYYLGPWVWGYHAYPDDYWRFSFSGLRALFPQIEWVEWWYSGTNKGIGLKVREQKNERLYFQSIKPITGAPSSVAEVITDRSMAYLNIGAIGKKH
jgi:hypothetical protein